VSGYQLVERTPSVEDYNRVREAAGLSRRNPAAAEAGLPNTLFGICVEREGRVVGIGRIIGDGGLFFRVVAVFPEHQKKGLGAKIMEALTSWLGERAPSGAYVQLIAGEGTSPFYEKYGFRVRTP
jgi:GNAT superfamily N-acetyltransferase